MIYENLRFLKRYGEIRLAYSHPIYGMQWKTHHETFRELEHIVKDQVDFIWFCANHSLITKSIFVFAPQYYVFCENYVESLHPDRNFRNIFRKRYIGKMRNMIDLEKVRISREMAAVFRLYSLNGLDRYGSDFIGAIKHLDHFACLDKLDYKNFLYRIVRHGSFREEFSDNELDLSFVFLNKLAEKIEEL